MKISIKFSFIKDQIWRYDQSILQGIFYKVLGIEEKHGTKFGLFSFSNIFFEKSDVYKAGETYNIYFSSIDEKIIGNIYEGLITKREYNFGNENKIFIKKIIGCKEDKIRSGKLLKIQTPLVLSLDENLCKKFNIQYERNGKPLFWNKDMGFDLFVAQLNKNLLKKYIFLIKEGYIGKLSEYDQKLLALDLKPEEFEEFAINSNFFKGFKFRRGALVDYKGGKIAGSLWNFIVGEDKNLIKVLQFVSQIGFGERCTAGFGFVG